MKINAALHMLDWNDFLPISASDVFRTVHAEGEWYIGLGRKGPKGWQNLGAFEANELAKEIGSNARLWKFLATDSYFTVNSLFSAAPWKSKLTGYQQFRRKKDSFKRLNCAWVDLDVGRTDDRMSAKNQTIHQALIKLFDLVDEMIIPEPNMLAFSGRGIYCFWLFERPLEANIQHKRMVEAFNKEIGHRLRCLAADVVTFPVTQVLRIPGSVHSKTGKAVRYFFKPSPRYPIAQLARFVGIKADPESYRLKCNLRRSCCPINNAKVKGARALNQYRIEDIHRVEAHLGGFKEGARRQSILFFAQSLRNAGYSKTEALAQCEAMANRCKPPIDSIGMRNIQDTVKWIFARRIHRIRTETLLEQLGVTSEMARLLKLRTIIPNEVRHERSPKVKRNLKYSFVRQLLVEKPNSSSADVAAACAKEGITISRGHAARLKKVFTVVPRSNPWTPRLLTYRPQVQMVRISSPSYLRFDNSHLNSISHRTVYAFSPIPFMPASACVGWTGMVETGLIDLIS